MIAKKCHVALYVLSLIFLAVYTFVLNNSVFTYDEPYYLTNVDLLNEYGLSKKFLEVLNGPAGPLYGVIHWLLQPLTSLAVKPVRAVNIIFLISTIFCIYKILKLQGTELAGAHAMSLLAIPMVFVCAGMALTEMPAMFFLALSIFIFIKSVKEQNILYSCLAGLFMSLAILGRQPYLLSLVALPLLLKNNFTKRNFTILVCFSIFSLCIPAYVFNVWGGLVPHAGGDVATREALAPYNLFISLGYSFLITLFIAPAWFVRLRQRFIVLYILTFILIVIVCYFADFRLNVMATVSQQLIGEGFLYSLYGNVMAAILIVSGLYFLYSAYRRVLATGISVNLNTAFVVGCLLTLISSVKITHQFSSRYVFQAAPFFILMFSGYVRFDYKMLILRIIAISIGIISLLSYFPM